MTDRNKRCNCWLSRQPIVLLLLAFWMGSIGMQTQMAHTIYLWIHWVSAAALPPHSTPHCPSANGPLCGIFATRTLTVCISGVHPVVESRVGEKAVGLPIRAHRNIHTTHPNVGSSRAFVHPEKSYRYLCNPVTYVSTQSKYKRTKFAHCQRQNW